MKIIKNFKKEKDVLELFLSIKPQFSVEQIYKQMKANDQIVRFKFPFLRRFPRIRLHFNHPVELYIDPWGRRVMVPYDLCFFGDKEAFKRMRVDAMENNGFVYIPW